MFSRRFVVLFVLLVAFALRYTLFSVIGVTRDPFLLVVHVFLLVVTGFVLALVLMAQQSADQTGKDEPSFRWSKRFPVSGPIALAVLLSASSILFELSELRQLFFVSGPFVSTAVLSAGTVFLDPFRLGRRFLISGPISLAVLIAAVIVPINLYSRNFCAGFDCFGLEALPAFLGNFALSAPSYATELYTTILIAFLFDRLLQAVGRLFGEI